MRRFDVCRSSEIDIENWIEMDHHTVSGDDSEEHNNHFGWQSKASVNLSNWMTIMND